MSIELLRLNTEAYAFHQITQAESVLEAVLKDFWNEALLHSKSSDNPSFEYHIQTRCEALGLVFSEHLVRFFSNFLEKEGFVVSILWCYLEIDTKVFVSWKERDQDAESEGCL